MNGGGQFSTGRSKLRIRSTNSNYSRNSGDINSIELSGVTAMMSGVTAKEKITFERFLADPICVNNIAPEHDMAPSNEKIKRAFQIIRASFCLLDTSGDGEITLEELQQCHNMMGELSIGKELKKAFNELPSLVMGDMVVVFANWVLFLDTEQSALNNNHVGNAEDKSVSEFSASQNGNDTNLDDLDDFDEAGEHKGEGASKSGKGGGDATNGSKLAQVNKKRTSRYRLLVRHVRKLLGMSNILLSEEEDMLDILCNTMHGQVGTIFKRFDADESGEIDREEFTALCNHAIGEIEKEEMDHLFNFFDGEKKGLITFEMLQKRLKDVENRKISNSSGMIFGGLHSMVLEQNSGLHNMLKSLRLIASFYYIFAVPFEISFIFTCPNPNLDTVFMFYTVDWVVDLTLYIDMFSKFHLSYVNKKSVKVTTLRKIRKHYLAHGFAYDIIALFPIDFLFYLAIGETSTTLGYFRLLRLLRVVDVFNYYGYKRSK
ncbi:hypothetical protein ScalyP_jg12036, partial [Parmales sp. scaly parma]